MSAHELYHLAVELPAHLDPQQVAAKCKVKRTLRLGLVPKEEEVDV